MDRLGFYMSSFEVKGIQRLNSRIHHQFSGLEKRVFARSAKISPGWGELTYLNSLQNPDVVTMRACLLLYVFALLEEQYGFAFEVSEVGLTKFRDPIFERMKAYAMRRLRAFDWTVPIIVARNALNRLLRIR